MLKKEQGSRETILTEPQALSSVCNRALHKQVLWFHGLTGALAVLFYGSPQGGFPVFELRFYTLDYEQSGPVLDYAVNGQYETLREAKAAIESSGSKWYFYPFPVIFYNGKLHSLCFNEDQIDDYTMSVDAHNVKNLLNKGGQ
jgi:hypothetical protein